MPARANPLLLHQFPSSHFNEKARWALDYKRIPHRRRSHLPGPHMLAIRRLTGQTATPVLVAGDEVIAGSARIIDWLEQRHPEPALYPEDPAQCARALELQRFFDTEVGPQVRCAMFSLLLDETGYFASLFSAGHSAPARALYRAMIPLAKGTIRKGNGVSSPAAIDAAFAHTQQAFDFVARESVALGYLVGDRFSVADLSAAALLAPALELLHPDMAKPTPMPAAIRGWLDRWAAHPGAAWAHSIYRRHRPTTSAL